MKYKISGNITSDKESLFTVSEILDAVVLMGYDKSIYMHANSPKGRIVIHRNLDGSYVVEVQYSACYFLKPVKLNEINSLISTPLELIDDPEKYGFKWYE